MKQKFWFYSGVFILSVLPVLIWAVAEFCGHACLK